MNDHRNYTKEELLIRPIWFRVAHYITPFNHSAKFDTVEQWAEWSDRLHQGEYENNLNSFAEHGRLMNAIETLFVK
jgi:hypothetical protein